MPFITISNGITIKVPTRGTTDWDETLRTDTFEKISEHDHTGSGKGLQLGSGAFADNTITGTKIRLSNDQPIRGRNAGDTADVNLIKANVDDRISLPADRALGQSAALNNNQTTAADITGLSIDSTDAQTARIEYAIYTDADTDLRERGSITVTHTGSDWDIQRESIGDDSQVTITITSAGQLQYTSANLAGHTATTIEWDNIQSGD